MDSKNISIGLFCYAISKGATTYKEIQNELFFVEKEFPFFVKQSAPRRTRIAASLLSDGIIRRKDRGAIVIFEPNPNAKEIIELKGMAAISELKFEKRRRSL